jgi:hypothetical protein
MQVSLMSHIGDGAGRSVVDVYIEQLAGLRDEGFRRLWTSQLPWTHLARSRIARGARYRGRHQRAAHSGPASHPAGAARPGSQHVRRGSTQAGPGGEPRRHVKTTAQQLPQKAVERRGLTRGRTTYQREA